MRDAFEALPRRERDALAHGRDAHPRVSRAAEGARLVVHREADGSELGQRVTPLDRVGIYVPGGKAAYPSSVLMNAIPAQVAGVREIVMVGARRPTACAIRWCSPPRISPA